MLVGGGLLTVEVIGLFLVDTAVLCFFLWNWSKGMVSSRMAILPLVERDDGLGTIGLTIVGKLVNLTFGFIIVPGPPRRCWLLKCRS